MIGIFVLALLGLWVWFAVWLSRVVSNRLLKFAGDSYSYKNNLLQQAIYWIGRLFIMEIILLLPFMDQLIAYPKWQHLCATTGEFEWGPGMNEKTAVGREVTAKFEQHQTTIFPNLKVEYSSKNLYDAKTQELIYRKPHFRYSARALIYLPSASGDKSAPFLASCTNYSVMVNGEDFYRKIQIK